MPATTRDPRADPRPGDLVRVHGDTRTVIAHYDGGLEVCFQYRPGYEVSQSLETWVEDCADAVIVKVAS